MKPTSFLYSYLGAIPYIGVALFCVYTDTQNHQIHAAQAILAYNVFITSFITGIYLHHISDQTDHNAATGLGLIAFAPAILALLFFGAALITLPVWPLFMMAVLALMTYRLDKKILSSTYRTSGYMRLRKNMTIITVAALLLCALSIKGVV